MIYKQAYNLSDDQSGEHLEKLFYLTRQSLIMFFIHQNALCTLTKHILEYNINMIKFATQF